MVAGPPTIILQGETEGIEVRYGTPWTDPGYIVGPGVSVNADALEQDAMLFPLWAGTG